MPRNKSYEFCGLTCNGETIAEAKQNWQAAIASLVNELAVPKCISFGGDTAIIWRDVAGWGYRLVSSECNHWCGTREATERSARWHLAQNAYKPGDGTTPPDILTNPVDRDSFHRWLRFQEAYAGAKSSGATDAEARVIADRISGGR